MHHVEGGNEIQKNIKFNAHKSFKRDILKSIQLKEKRLQRKEQTAIYI